MRVVLDTCVLVPNPIRKIFLALADQNLFIPLWSEKIFEEWEFFVSKNRTELVDSTRIEILLMKSNWRSSLVPRDIFLEKTLILPDENDRHVLASAITGKASSLVTNNLKDFPARILNKFGISPRSTDSFLLELFYDSPEIVRFIIQAVFELDTDNNFNKRVLKRYQLPRIAKVMFT